MLIFFVNDVDNQLILEFKDSFGKYNPIFPKITKIFFLGHPVYYKIFIDSLQVKTIRTRPLLYARYAFQPGHKLFTC